MPDKLSNPRRNLIIGTAGHIDHGKTVLVKALTGRDTDRLAEEKERGISIDLGFAPFRMSDGSVAGIVDVPGHESFIRNMLAGATGVDLALLVVAADDGVMPQTREHLAILDLLGVNIGVVAVTKADLVDEEMLELVEDEVQELLEGTSLEGSPVLTVSAATGMGVERLREELERRASLARLKDETAPPRLPIDRVFTLRGIGTVVTGTLWSGTLRSDEPLELQPAARAVRVRALQVHDADRREAYAGERVAANLAGISREDVSRGDVLTEPGYLRPTFMLDVRLRVLAGWPKSLKRGTRVRFHHGTKEILGRVYPFSGDRIEPGAEAPAQLRLESTAVVAPGDRFVLRSYSPLMTFGGGRIVDAHPRKHKLDDAVAVEEFARLESMDPAKMVSVYLERAGKPVTPARLVIAGGMPPDAVARGLGRLESGGAAVRFGQAEAANYIDSREYGKARAAVIAALEQFHAREPLADGMAKETLRKKVLASWDARFVDALFERMSADGELETRGKLVNVAGAGSTLTGEQERLMDQAVSNIEGGGFSPPTLSELASALGQVRRTLGELLTVAEKAGRVVRVSPELFFSPAAMAGIERKLRESARPGGITVSDFRNAVGTSRKFALPLLEYFDRNRVTVRVGDLRKLR